MLAVLALVLAQSAAAYDGFDQSAYVEKRLSEWKPAERYAVPAGALQSDAQALVGEWTAHRGFDGTTMTFFAPVDGRFKVRFFSGGCLGAWTLHRTAILKDGVVYLDKPVQPYCAEPYDRLFFVRAKDGLRLVPGGAMEEAQALVDHYKSGSVENWIEFFSLTKTVVRPG
jgi:hypothetical protein